MRRPWHSWEDNRINLWEIRLIWLKIGSSGELFWTRWWTSDRPVCNNQRRKDSASWSWKYSVKKDLLEVVTMGTDGTPLRTNSCNTALGESCWRTINHTKKTLYHEVQLFAGTVPHSGDICEFCLVFPQTTDRRASQHNKEMWACHINPADLHLIN